MTAEKPKAPLGFVRGGTTTLAYDNHRKMLAANAAQRRSEVDDFKAEAKANPREAKLHTLNLGAGQKHPMVVLVVKAARDNVILDYVLCELFTDDAGELVLNMACPKCAQATPPNYDNFKIHQSNRKFEFEPKKIPKELARHVVGDVWVNPKNPSEAVTIAGTINLVDRTRCPNLGCSYEFRIDDSVLRPA